MQTTQLPAPPPDARPGDDVHCPLCDYDLRGRGEPRCPECGYRFEWADLSDPRKKRHPFLFEHHPERNVRSFLRTVMAGLRPVRFWRSLHPTQPSRPRRLTAYAAVVVATALAAPGIRVAHSMVWTTLSLPSAYFPWTARGPNSTWDSLLIAWHYAAEPMAVAIAYFLLWAGSTYAALLVFRVSMRRARINPVHVRRCVVYSFDVWFWAGALAAVAALSAACLDLFGAGTSFTPLVAMNFPVLVYAPLTLLAALLAVLRLGVAYSLYLRFEHDLLTVLASQAVALLVVFNVSLYIATRGITL